MFYKTDDGFTNIKVEDSLQIQSSEEQRQVLNLITKSPYYSEEKYGSIDYMQSQWQAHNISYAIATSSKAGERIASIIGGSSTPAKSSSSLDLRQKGNVLRRQNIVYNGLTIVRNAFKLQSKCNITL